jgi:hypothetical protein
MMAEMALPGFALRSSANLRLRSKTLLGSSGLSSRLPQFL